MMQATQFHSAAYQCFGHHTITLLPDFTEHDRGRSRDIPLIVKNRLNRAHAISRVLGMAGRKEIAIMPPSPDFFHCRRELIGCRKSAWDTIASTPNLIWTILTGHPESIQESFPKSGNLVNLRNLCVGLVVNASWPAEALTVKINALRKAPLRYRMLSFHSLQSLPSNITDLLHGLNWLVLIEPRGEVEEQSFAICRELGIRYASFHQSATGPVGNGDLRCFEAAEGSSHPFGREVDLGRPTLPELHKMTAGMEVPLSFHLQRPPASSFPPVLAQAPEPAQEGGKPFGALSGPESSLLHPAEPLSKTHAETDPLEEFRRLDGIVRQGLSSFTEVGSALREIRERELWRVSGLTCWGDYCGKVAGISKSHANRLIVASELADRLREVTPIGVTRLVESQIRPLLPVNDPDTQIKAWRLACERANGNPSAKIVSQVVSELTRPEAPLDESPKPARSAIKDLVASLVQDVSDGCSREEILSRLRKIEALF